MDQYLQAGKVPKADGNNTIFDRLMRSSDTTEKNQAADLLATYSVKQIMGNLTATVTVEMVDNNRATVSGHDRHAMKVQFATQEEARAFAKKLFEEHGIHSLTFGPGKMKTPQNGNVFLTQDDLEKITQVSKIVHEQGTGALAYSTKSDAFALSRQVDQSSEAAPDEPRRFTP